MGVHFAVQFHPEVDGAQLSGWMNNGARAEADKAGQDPDVLLARTRRSLVLGSGPTCWLRIGIYPWPESKVRTVEWIGRRTVHELAHHLFDCRRLLEPAG